MAEPPRSLLLFHSRLKQLNFPSEARSLSAGRCCSEEVLHPSSACQLRWRVSSRAGEPATLRLQLGGRCSPQSRAASPARPRPPGPPRLGGRIPAHTPPSRRGREADRDWPPRSSRGRAAPAPEGEARSGARAAGRSARRSRGPVTRSPLRSPPGPTARRGDYTSHRPPRAGGGAGHCGSCSPPSQRAPPAERSPAASAHYISRRAARRAAGPSAQTFARRVSPRWRRGEGGALAPAAPTAVAAGRGEPRRGCAARGCRGVSGGQGAGGGGL